MGRVGFGPSCPAPYLPVIPYCNVSRENLPVGFSTRFQFTKSVYDLFCLKIQKTADSVILSLFMRTNGKCKFSRPLHRLVFCFLSEPNILEGPEYEKSMNTISMYGEEFYQLTPVATSR